MSKDWTADEIVGGRLVHDEEVARMCREAMADPESVTLVAKGRNGQTVQYIIRADHERAHLSVAHGFEQEEPPDRLYDFPHELWAPRWKRFTWEIVQTADFRPEDFTIRRSGHA